MLLSNIIQNRLRQVTMKFSLKTVNLKNVKAWDKPACYQLNVTVSIPKILYIWVISHLDRRSLVNKGHLKQCSPFQAVTSKIYHL